MPPTLPRISTLIAIGAYGRAPDRAGYLSGAGFGYRFRGGDK